MYSEIAVSQKPFRIGHMYIYTFLLRITNTMTSQNIDLSSWDTLYRHTWFGIVSQCWTQIQRMFPPVWPQEQIALNTWGKRRTLIIRSKTDSDEAIHKASQKLLAVAQCTTEEIIALWNLA
jgi:hypothetical protein